MPDTTGFSISDYRATIGQYRMLVKSYFGKDIETNSMDVANNMRFSTNSTALRGADPASIDQGDIKRRNPFTGKPGKSIFIPGEINDVMMVHFETQCFSFGLTPEYHLTHDGCFIRDENGDEQNLTNYAVIMKNLMLDRNTNSFMAGV